MDKSPSLYQIKYFSILFTIILLAHCKANTVQFFIRANYFHDHGTQKVVQCILYRDLPVDTFGCTVQICGFSSLDVASMDQAIPKEMWVRWDGVQSHNPTTQPMQPVSTANNINYDSK